MSWFKIPFVVCFQNLRKWAGDYRVWTVAIFIFVINVYTIASFQDYANQIGTGIAPWIFIFYSNSWWAIKVMMFMPLLILFCDAPFIDSNQPYILARSKRKLWSLGQILYIVVATIIYFAVMMLLSVVLLVGNMELTSDWGKLLYTAANSADNPLFIKEKILYYFTPFTGMLYSFILLCLSGIFIGLVIYVVNVLTKKSGFGILSGGAFIFWDVVVSMVTYDEGKEWLNYLSPVSWSTLQIIDIEGTFNTPSITFVLCGYAVLIIGLSVAAVMISRKQEINVIQAV